MNLGWLVVRTVRTVRVREPGYPHAATGQGSIVATSQPSLQQSALHSGASDLLNYTHLLSSPLHYIYTVLVTFSLFSSLNVKLSFMFLF